jgi:peptidoglycan/LPS O-acetylase OafA/YrhL
MRRTRLEWLDLFRGLAAVGVVLFHYRSYLSIPFLEFGNLAVDMFFVLSGIVLGRKYASAIAEGMSFRAFAKVRLIRLYPMTFVAGCFIVAMNIAGLPGSKISGVSAEMVWTVFLVTPLPGHWPLGVSFPPDPPVWSLWAEFVTNAIWFAAMRFGHNLMRIAWPILLVILFALVWQHHTMGDGFQQGTRMLTFALARALAWFSVGYIIGTTARPPVASAGWLLALLGVTCAFYSTTLLPNWLVSFGIVAISALLLHALTVAPPPSPWLAKVSKWLGTLSFPLYLTHLPAARLLPDIAPGLGRVSALLLAVGGVAIVSMFVSEALVRFLQRIDRHARPENLAPIPGSLRKAGEG